MPNTKSGDDYVIKQIGFPQITSSRPEVASRLHRVPSSFSAIRSRETTLPFLPSAHSNDWNYSANASKGLTSPVCRGRGITSAPSFGRVGPWHECDSKRCSHPVGMMQRALSNTFVSLSAVAWCGLTKLLDWEAIKLDGNARARLIFCTDTAAAATRSRDVVPFHA